MVIVEKYFPRGGTLSTKNETKSSTDIIFGTSLKKIHKRTSVINKPNTISNDVKETKPNLVSYDTVHEDMLIMGIVQKIDPLGLTVTLPGRMSATISALEISEAYCKMTSNFIQNSPDLKGFKPLTEIFRHGQIIYGRIKEIKESEIGRKHIILSLKPNDVHRDLSHSNIKKGFLFQGAIEEIQEHGYIIENGIKGLRSFLPKNKSSPTDYTVGQLLFLKVSSVKNDIVATTIICKEMKEDNVYLKAYSNPNIDYIMPATIVQYNITSILKDCIEGTIMNDSLQAYATEHHLNDGLKLPEDFQIGSVHKARILYVTPLTKQAFVILHNERNHENQNPPKNEIVPQYVRGDIVENARVHHLGTGGIVLVLENELKGLISYKSVKAPLKGNYDHDEIVKKYFKKSKHTIRILGYDLLECLYLCSDDPSIVNEKYFVLEDIKSGDFVTGIVERFDENSNNYIIKIGKLKGVLEKIYSASGAKLKENIKIRARVLSTNKERNTVYLTNRAEYMQKDVKILTNLKDGKPNSYFMGTIVKIGNTFVLVKFFNDIQGFLYTNTFLKNNLHSSSPFYEGKTTVFKITEIHPKKIILSLPEYNFEIGKICPVKVKHILESGIEIAMDMNPDIDESYGKTVVQHSGFIPINFLSDYEDIQLARLSTFIEGMTISTACIGRNIFSLRDVNFFQLHAKSDWSHVKPGDILRAFVINVENDIVELGLFLNKFDKSIKVHWKMIIQNSFEKSNIVFSANQSVYAKVLSKELPTKTLAISAKLMDVWDGNLSSTAEYIKKYLNEIEDIKRYIQSKQNLIAAVDIGDKIKAKFEKIDAETNDWIYSFQNGNLIGIVKDSLKRKIPIPKMGTEHECIVLWINYSNNLVYLSNKDCDLTHIQKGMKLPNHLKGKSGMTAKVLLKLETVIICSLKKGANPIVFLPMKLHYNDFENSVGINLKEGEFCKVAFIDDNIPIALPEATWKLWKNNRKRIASIAEDIPKKKRQLNNQVDSKDTEKNKSDNSSTKFSSNNKLLSDQNNPILPFFEDKHFSNDKETKNTQRRFATQKLLGVSNFWESCETKDGNNNLDSSSEEEQCFTSNSTQKRKRLTAAERFKQNSADELQLRAMEEKLADPNQIPETVEQFERLIMSDPNNSKNWINFMVFYLQSAEVDKARVLGQRALNTISFENTSDLLNIWAAIFNLELRYGTKESFNEQFKEALSRCDPFKLYHRLIDIYISAKKFDELIEVLNTFLRKFKKEAEAWKTAVDAYLQMNMPDKGQQILHRALSCLPEREHVNTIVAFANINNKYGNKEIAHTLFDQVVTSYPKRVDVWNQYADTLIKDNLTDQARSVLERAINQRIPLKKVRTIFKKLLTIEQQFGTDKDVERVKNLATEYVKNASS